MAYTKLFNEIITSTVWGEPGHVRLVWITMLAIKDIRQEVQASVPGLAHFARVSVEQCREAIKVLESPDPESRTKDFEGRRIKPIEGGWLVLNGDKYRDKMSKEDLRRYNAGKQREYYWEKKIKHQPVLKNTDSCRPNKFFTTSTQAEAEAEAEAYKYKYNMQPSEAQAPQPVILSKSVTPPPLKGSHHARHDERALIDQFQTFWKEYPRKIGKVNAQKAWLKHKPDLTLVLDALHWQKRQDQWNKDKGEFIPHPATWLNQHRWQDERPEPVKEKSLFERVMEKKAAGEL